MDFAKKNISYHCGFITTHDRENLLQQKGAVLWLTGLSGSGKSTIARELEKKLFESGHSSYVLDGDNIRHGLNKDLGFQPEERTENIRRIAEVANLFADAGIITIVAFISPYKKDRLNAKHIIGAERFFEIYLNASLAVCEKRDTKHLYQKARKGEINNFTGIDDPYEVPGDPHLILDTMIKDIHESVMMLFNFLVEKRVLFTRHRDNNT